MLKFLTYSARPYGPKVCETDGLIDRLRVQNDTVYEVKYTDKDLMIRSELEPGTFNTTHARSDALPD